MTQSFSDPGTKAAIEFARDSSKQVLTLATGVLTITLTFVDKVVKIGDLTDGERYLLFAAWLVLVLSMLLGVVALLLITGNASPTTRTDAGSIANRADYHPSIYAKGVQGSAVGQMITFLLGIVLLVVFGFMTTNDTPAAISTTTTTTTTSTSVPAAPADTTVTTP